MKCVVKQKAVQELLREVLTVPDKPSNAPIVVSEPPVPERPIDASPEVNIDGIFTLPPVDDERFSPTSGVALSQSAYALMKKVPPGQVKKVYNVLQQIIQDAEARQEQEDLRMAKDGIKGLKERAIKHLKVALNEAGEDDFVPPRPVHPVTGMLKDYEEDAPDELNFPPDFIQRLRTAMAQTSDKGKPKFSDWSSARLGKEKEDYKDEPWMVDSKYKPEPAEPLGYGGNYATYEQIAQMGDIEGLNTPSAVKQFLLDPRKLNLMDKVHYLLRMPERERYKIMIGAAADFLDMLEGGGGRKGAIAIDHTDPAIKEVIKHYISDLEAEGALEPEDSQAMRSRSEYVVELDSFKKYLVEYFDDNFDTLLKFAPFREHLRKYWQDTLRNDPELMAHVERRKQKDIDRVQADKAARASGTFTRKSDLGMADRHGEELGSDKDPFQDLAKFWED
jgi:hypothetical protein